MRNLTTKSGRQNLQVCLQGEDSLETCGCPYLKTQGLVFQSMRRLDLMANVIIRIECSTAGCRSRILLMEGIVIGSEESGDGSFENTVLFLQEQDSDFWKSGEGSFPPAKTHLLN
jgi:hypothetical protein